jgi:hypothetical protein
MLTRRSAASRRRVEPMQPVNFVIFVLFVARI